MSVAKSIHPVLAGVVVNRLQTCIDDMIFISLGYKPSEENNLCRSIAKLALLAKKYPKNVKLRKELKGLLERYEKEFDWLNKLP